MITPAASMQTPPGRRERAPERPDWCGPLIFTMPE